MKKITALFLSLMIMSPTVFADDDITVYLNEDELIFEQSPIIQNDSTLVPFRAIFENLDMVVQWFGDEQRVTAQKDDLTITLFIDENTMYVNDTSIELNTPPIIYNDYTLVPLRAVSESAGAEVFWDGDTHTVYIETDNESDFDDWGYEVLNLVNEERAKYNVAPLKWDDSLAALAESHCEDMIDRNFFAHNTPDGKTPFDRMKAAGISYSSAGENIAAGQSSPQNVMDSWMNSPGHRKNILNPDFEYIGVGLARGGSYGIYWAQEFATFK